MKEHMLPHAKELEMHSQSPGPGTDVTESRKLQLGALSQVKGGGKRSTKSWHESPGLMRNAVPGKRLDQWAWMVFE